MNDTLKIKDYKYHFIIYLILGQFIHIYRIIMIGQLIVIKVY